MINYISSIVLFVVSGILFPDSSNAKEHIERIELPKKHSGLTASLQSLVEKSKSYIELDSKPRVKIEQILRSASKNDFSIISMRINYSNYSNSYCRLAIKESGQMNLIDLPKAVDFDNCQRVSSATFYSFNGKNEAIIILSTLIPSNRYAEMATVQQVYVPSSGNAYCYSSRASEALNAFGKQSKIDPEKLIKSESLRRSIDLMVCAN